MSKSLPRAVWAAAIAVLVCPLPSQGNTRVVRDAASLVSAAADLDPGDTLLLLPGTYTVSTLQLSALQGRPDAWIAIRSVDPRSRARIVGTSTRSSVVGIRDCAYLRLEDLEISGTGAANVDALKFEALTSSRDVVIDNCLLHSVDGNGIASQADRVERVRIQGCEIRDAGNCGIYVGYDSPARLVVDCVIRDSWIHHCSLESPGVHTQTGYGIQIKGGSHGNLVENNVLHDVAGTTRAAIAVYWADPNGGQPRSRWNTVRGNVIWNSGNEGIYATNSACIENNVVFDVDDGVVVTSYGGHVVDNLRIANNTVLRCSGHAMYLTGLDGADASVEVLDNALFAPSSYGSALRMVGTGHTVRVAGNVAHGTVHGASGGVRSVGPASTALRNPDGDPGTIDPYPRVDGPLVDAAVAATSTDVDGVFRPHGLAGDVGAYEWTPAGGPQRIAQRARDAVGALRPLLQVLDRDTGGSVGFDLHTRAAVGSPWVLLISLSGPDPAGSIGVLWDDATSLLVDQGQFRDVYPAITGVVTGPHVRLFGHVPMLPSGPHLNVHQVVHVHDQATGRFDVTEPVRLVIAP